MKNFKKVAAGALLIAAGAFAAGQASAQYYPPNHEHNTHYDHRCGYEPYARTHSRCDGYVPADRYHHASREYYDRKRHQYHHYHPHN